MTKADVVKAFKNAKKVVSKHSPEILTGLGIAGMVTTTVLAVKATPKALELIEEKKETEGKDELTPVEVVQATWKCYAPAVVTGVVSTACLIGSNSVSTRRSAALATAYKLSENALSEYKEKVIEELGEKKEKHIREKVETAKVEKQPVSTSEVHVTGKGQTLCYDGLSGRYFESSVEEIRSAENELNNRMLHDITGYASLNEFYDEIGLAHTEVGDMIGWKASHLIKIHIGATVSDDNRPCLTLIHDNRPIYEYDE